VAVVFLIMGFTPGSIWARIIWGNWWTRDARLTIDAPVTYAVLAQWRVLRDRRRGSGGPPGPAVPVTNRPAQRPIPPC